MHASILVYVKYSRLFSNTRKRTDGKKGKNSIIQSKFCFDFKNAEICIIMDTRRQLKYAKLIQKELSDIFQHDKKSLLGSAFVTITNVEVSPDLGLAKIYLSFMLVEDKNLLLETIKTNAKVFRQALGIRIKNVARIVPELAFFLDDSAEYAIKMDQLITSLNIPKEDK